MPRAPVLGGTYVVNWSEFCSAQFGVQVSASPTGLLSGLTVDSNSSADVELLGGTLGCTFHATGWSQ